MCSRPRLLLGCAGVASPLVSLQSAEPAAVAAESFTSAADLLEVRQYVDTRVRYDEFFRRLIGAEKMPPREPTP
jgi:TnpA family transposase